jgi:hypothetical protein
MDVGSELKGMPMYAANLGSGRTQMITLDGHRVAEFDHGRIVNAVTPLGEATRFMRERTGQQPYCTLFYLHGSTFSPMNLSRTGTRFNPST